MADSVALRSMRYRKHRDGDHSLCRHKPIEDGQADPGRLVAAILAEFPETDDMSRQLALRLAELASGSGAASVQAVRALGELVAWQREGR